MGSVTPINGAGDKYFNQRRAIEELLSFAANVQGVVPQLIAQVSDLRLSIDSLCVWVQRRMDPEHTPQDMFREVQAVKAEIIAAGMLGEWLRTMTSDADKERAWAERIGTTDGLQS